jgi:outer membrane protein assembly factor BamB
MRGVDGQGGRRRSLPRWRSAIAALATLGMAAGLAPAASAARLRWRRGDLAPVSQPAAAGRSFVLYVAERRGLVIVGLDAHTGRTLWHARASTSQIATGASPGSPTVVGRDVIYLRRGQGRVTRLIGVDARTGRTRWEDGPALVSSWPGRCPGAQRDVCVTVAAPPHASITRLLRIDPRTGRQLAATEVAPTFFGRAVGFGLFDEGVRDPEQLAGVSGSTVLWSEPLSDIFNVPELSTDWGWDFDRAPRLGVFVGSVDGPPLSTNPSLLTIDLSRTMTAGFRISDGSVVWRDPGATYVCGTVFCPGEGSSLSGATDLNGPTVGVRARETGTVSGKLGTRPEAAPGDRAVLEGFDPASGKALWSFNAGFARGLLTGLASPAQVAPGVVALANAAGRPMVLDLASGAARPATASTRAWCGALVVYRDDTAPAGRKYIGGPAAFPCDARGRPMPVPAHIPAFVGDRTAGVSAWSARHAVVAV